MVPSPTSATMKLVHRFTAEVTTAATELFKRVMTEKKPKEVSVNGVVKAAYPPPHLGPKVLKIGENESN